MATRDSTDTLVLRDVSWDTYEKLTDALSEHRFRHTYQSGMLEIFANPMFDVSWEEYEGILDAFGDHRFRHTYQQGTLEMMSPSSEHERIKEFLGRLVDASAMEFDIQIRSAGSSTRRTKRMEQGLEPDKSYFVEQRGREAAVRDYDDPASAPDLAIEIDLRHPDLNRLKSYAILGVREVWQYRNETLTFFALQPDLRYDVVAMSTIFPSLSSVELTDFVRRLDASDENKLTREFMELLRTKHRT